MKNRLFLGTKKSQEILSNHLKNKNTRRLLYGILVFLSLLFVGYAVAKNWAELSQQEWDVDIRFIVLAVFAYPFGMLPTVAAWHKLLDSIDIQVPFSTNLRFYSLSSLPRHIPGLVWHVSSRTLLYQDIGFSGSRIVVATGLETVFLTLTGSIVSLLWFALTKPYDNNYLLLQIVAVAAITTLIAFLLWTPGFNQVLKKLQSRWGIKQPIQIKKRDVIIGLFWMFLAWAGGGLILFILTKGFVSISWWLLPNMIGIWGAAGAISLSIGALIQGMGLREITLTALLSSIVPLITAVVIAIAFRLALTLGEIIWVLLFTWMTKAPPNHTEGAQNNSDT